MTVGIENTAHVDNTTLAGSSSVTIASFTVTSANALCVAISFLTLGGTPPTSITATWDSGGTNQAMTQVAHATASGLDAYIFGLLAPTTGAHTLSVTWTNNANWGIGVVGLTGVTQTSLANAFRNASTNTGTGTTASVTIPTSANSGVIGVAVDNDPASSASGVSNTVLLLGNGVVSNNAGDFVSNYQIPSNSTSVTLSYALGSSSWAYAGISVLAPVKLEWGFEQYNQFQSPYSTVKNTHRAGGIKGKSGFAVSPIPFREGWQVQPPQPPFHPTIQKRSAAFSHPEEGIEGKYNAFKARGWQVQPWQPPVNPQKNKKGSILKGIDGIEGKFINFLTYPFGWEVQPPQPPNRPTTNQKAEGALSHPEDGIEAPYTNVPVGWWIQLPQPPAYPTSQQKYSGTKGKTTASFYSLWVNGGWEIQSVQPPGFPKTNQKIGALSQWEDGIESPYVFISPQQPIWGFDVQQPPLKINYRSSAWSQKTEGIEYPFNKFSPAGWEIQPSPPPHIFIEKKGAVLKGDDGTQDILKRFFPSGWEVQPPQPPASPKTSQKTGALSHPEDGIEAPYAFISPTQIFWGHYRIQPTTSKIYYKGGAWSQWEDGIEFPYVNVIFHSSGWEVQPVQPPAFPNVNIRYGALSHPEEGLEHKPPAAVLLNWGFESQTPWQPPTYPTTYQKIGALSQWEDGIEGLYVFVAPAQPIWGFDIQSFQPISIPTNQQKYSGIKGKSGFAVFTDLIPVGWEVQPVQPPIYPTIQQKIGALSQWEDGIEGPYVFVPPTPTFWGFDIQASHLFPRYLPNAKSVPNSGDDGTQAQYVNFHPYGWEIQPPQPPNPIKVNIKYSALSHPEEGIEGKYVFVAPPVITWSFDIQQPPLKVNYRSGAWSQWEDGIEAPYVFVPPLLTPRGWEVQPFQPPFYPSVRQRGSAAKGKSEFAIISPWVFNVEIQPIQLPYYLNTKQKYGALSHPEEGIEGKYVFVPSTQINWARELPHFSPRQRISNRYSGIEGTSEFASFTFQPYGWEIQSVQPSITLKGNQKTGALSHPEEGIEGLYVFVPPVIPPINIDVQQPLLPPLKINYRGGAWSQWEDGIEAPYVNFLPYLYGWEVQPPQPPFSPRTNQKIGALSQWEDGTEGKYVFVAPPSIIWGFDIQPTTSKVFYRSGSWSQRTEGIDAPYINFHPYGWEIQPPQPPNPIKVNIKYSALSHPEEGIEGKYVFVAPPPIIWSFDFQQPPLKINYRSGAWSQREDGTEYPLVNLFPSGWEIQPPQPPSFPNISRKYGSLSHPEDGIEGLFIPPPSAALNWGFEFQTPWQPPYFPRVNQRGPAIKGKAEFAFYSPWVNGGWEIQWVQPPSAPKTRQKQGASSHQDRIDSKFIFVPPPAIKWGWETLPPHLRPLIAGRHFGLEGASEFASFTFQPFSWELQWVQPPTFPGIRLKSGALSHAESGIEGQFVFVPPAPIIWGHDIQPVISRIYYRSGAWSQREDGIEGIFNAFYARGWQIQPFQPPHPKPEVRAAAILRGIDSIELPLIVQFPKGWEIQSPQPPYFLRINQKTGALSHPEEGIEGKYVFIAPPFFTNSWEIQPFQPRHTFIERRGVILRGIDGTEGKFIVPFINGWEIQPPPPPFFLKTRQKIGATSHPEEGIEGVYVFVPPPPIIWAWEIQSPQPRYWITTQQAGGAFSHWEDGIEGLYVFVPPTPPIPPVPPPSPAVPSGLNYRDMQVLGISPSSTLYWDYGNTEAFYIFQNDTNTLYRVSARTAFNWYGVTPNATTIYNPFLTTILGGGTIRFSDDNEN